MSGTEERATAALARGDHDGATTAVLEGYGPEILGLLVALNRDHDVASDAFSLFAERLWLSMKRFEGKCSLRTWAYLLARRVSTDVARAARPDARRKVPLSLAPQVSALVARVRTNTLSILSEEKVSAFTALRNELPEDDQLLLVLRVDRELAWEDLARVFLDAEEVGDPESDAIKRESARLRKRFQLVKERLRALGRDRGIVE